MKSLGFAFLLAFCTLGCHGGASPAAPSVAVEPSVSFNSAFGQTVSLPASRSRLAITGMLPALAAPDLVAAPVMASPQVTGSTVRLSWTATTAGCCELPSSFILQYGFSAGFDPARDRTFSTGNRLTSLTLENVPPGIYYARVLAFYETSGALSAPSNERMIAVGCTFAAPVLTSQVTDRDVFLAWTRDTSDDLYELEVNGRVEISGYRQATLTNLNTPDGVYRVRVRTINTCGTGAWSDTVTVTVSTSTGPLKIENWRASFTISRLTNGNYRSTGTIDLTLNRAVTGSYRAEFNSYPFLGATKTFSGAVDLHFDVTKDSSGCPDFHNTIPLYLYDAAGSIVASANTTHRGTGCAFN